LRAALESALHRRVAVVNTLPDEGPALRVNDRTATSVEILYRAPDGTWRNRSLLISSSPNDAAREIALLAAEMASDERPPSQESQLEIEGDVKDQSGAPIAEARLALKSGDKVIQATDTDQLGRFRLPDLAVGNFTLEVSADDCTPKSLPLILDGSLRGLTLELARGPHAEAKPWLKPDSPEAEIEGQIRDPDGQPVAGARIVLHGPTGQEVDSTDTDQAGRFRFPSAPLGADVLEVESPGFASLRHSLTIEGPVTGLQLRLLAVGGPGYRTVVQSTQAPLPTQDGTSTTVINREDVAALPGGTSQQLNSVLATQPGFSPDNYGAVHVRGNFAGLQLRVDGIQLPPAIQDRLEQLLEPQIIDHTTVIVGGLPVEYGEDVAGVIDVTTRRPSGPWQGDAQLTYGTYNHVEGQANAAGSLGPINAVIAGAVQTTDRGLDPPAASPIIHDQMQEGRAFLRLEDQLGAHDRLELLSVYAETHYQIPLDPTVLPLSDGPTNAVRGTDQYGNTPPDYVPLNSNPTELERESFTGLSWFHKFNDRAELQVAPFGRYQESDLTCDVASQLGPTADPGQTCSTVQHEVVQGGLQASQTFGVGAHNDFKAGLLVDYQRSSIVYDYYTRDDSNPQGGADPSQTLSGEDDIDTFLTGAYFQDTIRLGRLTLLPGVRIDVLQATEPSAGASSTLWGPSARLGAAYAFTDALVLHAYVGELWQPPSFDAPAAARILGLVPANAPVPFDLKAETDQYAEIGLADRIIPQLTLSVVAWGRISQNTLDDNEVGDTALTADYNYVRGRAGGAELWGKLTLGKSFHAFANVTAMVAQGEGINSSLYLFTPAQLAFTGYQAVDNAQDLATNVGFDLADNRGTTHLSGLLTAGSGLRTGPTNNATLPPNAVINMTVRHIFAIPLRPELALDVLNVFNEVYAYRISTGSLAGTAYGSLRQVMLRLIVPFGSER
jgi:outer membrane cobalamin receptor